MRRDFRGGPSPVGRGGWHEGRIPGPDEPSLNGIFAVNPIRRTLGLIAGCLLVIAAVVLLLQNGGRGSALLLVVAALAAALLLIAVPLLVWSIIAEIHRRHRRRTSPDLADLRLSLRTENILRRAGYETVADIVRLDDDHLLGMPRMADHDVRQIRRALSVWTYRQWQEAGFPDR